MFAEPPGFDRAALVEALRDGWGIAVAALDYAPVGFGSHHYRVREADGTGWFVTVDIGADPGALDASLAVAAALADAGLEFAHAPRRRPDGRCVTVTGAGDAVSVVAVIQGESHDFGEIPAGPVRTAVLAALGRMHAARVPGPEDPLTVPGRADLAAARARLGEPWDAGPYAARTRELLALRGGLIDELFARYDALVPAVRAGRDGWVVTHGEPHAGNVMLPAGGGVRLIDWDTAAIGPPERDLWMLTPRSPEEWAAYGRADAVDPDATELYRLRWTLSEICAFTGDLRRPHADDANTRIAWRELSGYLTPAI